MAKASSQYDYIIKLIIIGDSGVGKTCILLRFSDDSFTTSHLTTIGIDFKLKNITIEGKKIKLQIWDTAGQERFRAITQNYYKGAMGIILAYDCTDENSFNNIKNWVQQLKGHSGDNVPKILVGNKCDRPDKKISSEQGEELANELGIRFFETSAKTNVNVSEIFSFITKEVVDMRIERRTHGESLGPKVSEKKGCC